MEAPAGQSIDFPHTEFPLMFPEVPVILSTDSRYNTASLSLLEASAGKSDDLNNSTMILSFPLTPVNIPANFHSSGVKAVSPEDTAVLSAGCSCSKAISWRPEVPAEQSADFRHNIRNLTFPEAPAEMLTDY